MRASALSLFVGLFSFFLVDMRSAQASLYLVTDGYISSGSDNGEFGGLGDVTGKSFHLSSVLFGDSSNYQTGSTTVIIDGVSRSYINMAGLGWITGDMGTPEFYGDLYGATYAQYLGGYTMYLQQNPSLWVGHFEIGDGISELANVSFSAAVSIVRVPEPASVLLLGAALFGLASCCYWRRVA
ncbi:PEP-CTERM sorting domain-containing protein [Paracraurococcus lichenis]|uniref:PEP-CTERM sorting domain-containing protein n=1 Tax=Paracraurococcus lichenis TaxID=3064888 RepID=A0ABT9E4P6_9PROT|nr:PEP-CTERM sorting domain-containing protein [Paracraurococcus sp. LOR1-02]MDO9711050.1 PEP-CTERM sorting domain-containing protein [Paracraurococcus sp. LOR1-02]